jgi:anti-sigma28 factor (negative regulator of flagellin synthesis)
MYIYPKSSGSIRPESTSQPLDVSETAAVKSVAPGATSSDRSDKVEISDAGRALAARDGKETTSKSGLEPARADQIRGRILSGAYDTLEVVDTVARRLLDSGDF